MLLALMAAGLGACFAVPEFEPVDSTTEVLVDAETGDTLVGDIDAQVDSPDGGDAAWDVLGPDAADGSDVPDTSDAPDSVDVSDTADAPDVVIEGPCGSAGAILLTPQDNLVTELAVLAPNTIVCLTAGVYTPDSPIVAEWPGEAGSPINVMAVPGAEVEIYQASSVKNVFVIEQGDYFELSGMTIRGGRTAVDLEKGSYARIERLTIHDQGLKGIAVGTKGSADVISLKGNVIFDTGEDCITVGNGIAPTGTVGVVGNHLYNCDQFGVQMQHGVGSSVIADNVIHDVVYPAVWVGQGTTSQMPNVVERNLLWNSLDSVLQVAGRVTIKNNIIFNGLTCIRVQYAGADYDTVVTHNTTSSCDECFRANNWSTPQPGRVVAYNAFACDGKIALVASGAPAENFTGNVGVGSVDASIGDGIATFTDSSNWFTDPEALKFDLKAGAPLIDAGQGLGGSNTVTRDFDGRTRGPSPDIGAYEYSLQGPVWTPAKGLKPVVP